MYLLRSESSLRRIRRSSWRRSFREDDWRLIRWGPIDSAEEAARGEMNVDPHILPVNLAWWMVYFSTKVLL
jgi:hypothetical protein